MGHTIPFVSKPFLHCTAQGWPRARGCLGIAEVSQATSKPAILGQLDFSVMLFDVCSHTR